MLNSTSQICPREMAASFNNLLHTNRRLRFGFGGFGLFGRWICCHRPLPAAVGGSGDYAPLA
jgi:hypothetical protein